MYELRKDTLTQVLRRFDRRPRGERWANAEKDVDMVFVNRFRISDFFIRLFETFDPSVHVTNSMEDFRQSLKAWNEAYSDAVLNEADLLGKFYIVIGNGRVVANPELHLGGVVSQRGNAPEVRFLQAFDQRKFHYPLFAEEHLAGILAWHNEVQGLELTIDVLRQGAEDVHHAIFSNAAKMHAALVEALKNFLGAMPFDEFKARVEWIFLLLVELRASEIWLAEVVGALDSIKRQVLCEYGLARLEREQDADMLTSFGYLNRLTYIRHELEGMDIMNPPPDSLVVAYNPKAYEDQNSFETAEVWGHFYREFDFGFSIKRLLKESDFVLDQLLPYLPPAEVAVCVSAKISPYFRFKLAEYFDGRPSAIPAFAFVEIAPILTLSLLEMNLPRGDAKVEGDVEVRHFFPEAIDWLMGRFQDQDEEMAFQFLQEFYLYLTKQVRLATSMHSGLAQREKRGMLEAVRAGVMRRLADAVRRESARLDALTALLANGKHDDDFTRYDMLTQLSREQAGFDNGLIDLLIGHMREWMETSKFYSTFFQVEGFDNLQHAFDRMPEERFAREVLSYNWDALIGVAGPDSYLVERKARCYLGLLAKYGKSGSHEQNVAAAATYVLSQVSTLKRGVGERSPLSWEEMITDTFVALEPRMSESLEDVLWSQVLDVLIRRGEAEAADFLFTVEERLSFSEAVMWNKAFPSLAVDSDLLKPMSVEDVSLGLGMAEREALFLLRNGYASEGLLYIQYLRKLGSERPDLKRERGELWKALELEGLLGEKRIDEAAALERRMEHRDAAREGLIRYLQGDYSGAAVLFERHLAEKPSSLYVVVNYAAALIMLERYDEAIRRCEPLLAEHPEECLLHANLACAYAPSNKGKAFYYYFMAQSFEPDYTPAQLGVLESLRGILEELLPELLDRVHDGREKQEVLGRLSLSMQRSALHLNDLAIPDAEMKLLRVINHAIQQQLEHPTKLEGMSETDLSDWITMLCRMALPATFPWESIVMEREAPQGYAVSRSGELDFFVYRSGDRYENIATGENKEWSPQRYVGQLKQLLGYMRNEGGCGFTIIFNKGSSLDTVLQGRRGVLEEAFKRDDDLKPFGRVGPIFDMELLESQFKHVLLTKHRHPEEEGAVFRVYHFVVNGYRAEHKQAARSARGK